MCRHTRVQSFREMWPRWGFQLLLFYVYGCFASMCVHAPHVFSAHRGQKRVGFPGTGTIDGCKLQYGCWKSNPGLLELQPVLATTEYSLQPLSNVLSLQSFLNVLSLQSFLVVSCPHTEPVLQRAAMHAIYRGIWVCTLATGGPVAFQKQFKQSGSSLQLFCEWNLLAP